LRNIELRALGHFGLIVRVPTESTLSLSVRTKIYLLNMIRPLHDGVVEAHTDETKGSVSVEETASLEWGDPRELRNARNWSLSKKLFHTVIPCVLAFLV
jgi:hypothetical protein